MGLKTQTSTQIRNFYSDGLSYLNMKFYNINLAFHFYQLVGEDPSGKLIYDKEGLSTTITYDSAYALYVLTSKILNNEVEQAQLEIPCYNDAKLILQRVPVNNELRSVITIQKNSKTISFIFKITTYEEKINGKLVTKQIESQLGVFHKTLEGYLTGINSERHLNKLTDDFIKYKESIGEAIQPR